MRIERKVPGGYVKVLPLDGWIVRLNESIAIEVPVFFHDDEGRVEAGVVTLGAEPLMVAEQEAVHWAKRYTRKTERGAHGA